MQISVCFRRHLERTQTQWKQHPICYYMLRVNPTVVQERKENSQRDPYEQIALSENWQPSFRIKVLWFIMDAGIVVISMKLIETQYPFYSSNDQECPFGLLQKQELELGVTILRYFSESSHVFHVFEFINGGYIRVRKKRSTRISKEIHLQDRQSKTSGFSGMNQVSKKEFVFNMKDIRIYKEVERSEFQENKVWTDNCS